ncbi:MAG: hypothetical protein AAFV53_35755 [Myxococcota bacterium]
MMVLLSLLLSGCAADRAQLSVPIVMTGSNETVTPTPQVSVRLTAAELVIGDLRFESPPEVARRWRPSLLSIGHAHPGHDFSGDVDGELLGEWSIDLLALSEPMRLGEASFYEGDYESARLELPDGGAVLLEGYATVEGLDTTRSFRFALLPEQSITGIPFITTVDADTPPQQVSLSIDLGHALSFIDWAAPDDGDGLLTEADDDGVVGNAALFGAVSTPTYSFIMEP